MALSPRWPPFGPTRTLLAGPAFTIVALLPTLFAPKAVAGG
jgi:hypothetical protein